MPHGTRAAVVLFLLLLLMLFLLGVVTVVLGASIAASAAVQCNALQYLAMLNMMTLRKGHEPDDTPCSAAPRLQRPIEICIPSPGHL
jgi:heme A synthase